jgi:hypothetical protein
VTRKLSAFRGEKDTERVTILVCALQSRNSADNVARRLREVNRLDVSEFHAGHDDRDVRFAQFMSGEKKVGPCHSV